MVLNSSTFDSVQDCPLATIVKDSVKPVWEQGNLHSGLLWMRPCRLQACHIFVCQRPRLSTAPTCYHVSEPNVWRLYIHVNPYLITKCYNRILPTAASSSPTRIACASHPVRDRASQSSGSCPVPPSHALPVCTTKAGPPSLRRSQKAFSRVGGGNCANPSPANFVGVLMYGAPPYQPVGLPCVPFCVTHGIRRHGVMD